MPVPKRRRLIRVAPDGSPESGRRADRRGRYEQVIIQSAFEMMLAEVPSP
jgi:hypothetical protein